MQFLPNNCCKVTKINILKVYRLQLKKIKIKVDILKVAEEKPEISFIVIFH